MASRTALLAAMAGRETIRPPLRETGLLPDQFRPVNGHIGISQSSQALYQLQATELGMAFGT